MFLNFGSRLILARLIAPESWGLFAEAFLIITFAGAIRNLGLPYQLIRDKENHYGNVMLIEIIMSVILILVVQIFAPLASYLNPALPHVLQVFSILIFFEGIAVVPKAFIDKELIVKKAVIPEILKFLVFAVVSVFLAWKGLEIWSLIYAQIISAVVYFVLIWNKVRGILTLKWTLAHTSALIRKSKYLFTIMVFSVLWGYIDNGIIGVLLSEDQVGYYFMAYTVAVLLPKKIIYPSLNRVLYPSLVKFRNEEKKFIKTYHYGTLLLMSLEVPLAFFLFFNADFLVNFLLGSNWVMAIPLVRVLSLSPISEPIGKLGVEVLIAEHHDRTILFSYIVHLVSIVCFGWFFITWFGVIGMAYANFVLLGSIPIILKVRQRIKGDFINLLKKLGFVYISTFVVFFIIFLITRDNLVLRVILSICSLPIIWFVIYKRFGEFFKNVVKTSIQTFWLKKEAKQT